MKSDFFDKKLIEHGQALSPLFRFLVKQQKKCEIASKDLEKKGKRAKI